MLPTAGVSRILRARQQQNSSRPLFLYLSFFTKPYSAYGERRGPTKRRQLSEMDAAVGGVVAELARAGEMNNTIVMFVSDNGAREAEPGTASANYPLREQLSWGHLDIFWTSCPFRSSI